MKQMFLVSSCFQFCRCGKENGNDGSTVYAWSEAGINTSFVSALRCPQHGDQCWYGIIILCNGVLDSRNINISNSDVEYIVGLAHFRPDYENSILLYYSSVNQINGNALAFVDFTFPGKHQYGALVNDSSTSGIFYIQNTTTTLEDYYFLNNRGPFTYMAVGSSKGNFVNCVFDQENVKKNRGNGFGEVSGCQFGVSGATTPALVHLNTAFCQGNTRDGGGEVRVARGASAVGVVAIAVIGVVSSGVLLWRRRVWVGPGSRRRR
jgi:hypothetical protein